MHTDRDILESVTFFLIINTYLKPRIIFKIQYFVSVPWFKNFSKYFVLSVLCNASP